MVVQIIHYSKEAIDLISCWVDVTFHDLKEMVAMGVKRSLDLEKY